MSGHVTLVAFQETHHAHFASMPATRAPSNLACTAFPPTDATVLSPLRIGGPGTIFGTTNLNRPEVPCPPAPISAKPGVAVSALILVRTAQGPQIVLLRRLVIRACSVLRSSVRNMQVTTVWALCRRFGPRRPLIWSDRPPKACPPPSAVTKKACRDHHGKVGWPVSETSLGDGTGPSSSMGSQIFHLLRINPVSN